MEGRNAALPGQDGGDRTGPTILWHCGFQKTATSTAQSILRVNLALLSRHVTLLPKAHWTRALRTAAHAFWHADTPPNRLAVEQAVEDLVRTATESGRRTAVISDENILGDKLVDGRQDVFRFAARILPLIAAAAAPARSVFVFYTRELEPWLKSAYGQQVKARRATESWDDWREAIWFGADFEAQCARLVTETGLDIRYLSLEDETAGGNWPGHSLLSLAGVPEATIDAMSIVPVRHNASLPPGALHFMREANRSTLHNRDLRAVRRIVRRNPGLFSQEAI